MMYIVPDKCPPKKKTKKNMLADEKKKRCYSNINRRVLKRETCLKLRKQKQKGGESKEKYVEEKPES